MKLKNLWNKNKGMLLLILVLFICYISTPITIAVSSKQKCPKGSRGTKCRHSRRQLKRKKYMKNRDKNKKLRKKRKKLKMKPFVYTSNFEAFSEYMDQLDDQAVQELEAEVSKEIKKTSAK